MEERDQNRRKKLEAIIDEMNEKYGESFRRLAEHPAEGSSASDANEVSYEESRTETNDNFRATREKINERYNRTFKRLAE